MCVCVCVCVCLCIERELLLWCLLVITDSLFHFADRSCYPCAQTFAPRTFTHTPARTHTPTHNFSPTQIRKKAVHKVSVKFPPSIPPFTPPSPPLESYIASRVSSHCATVLSHRVAKRQSVPFHPAAPLLQLVGFNPLINFTLDRKSGRQHIS